MSSPGASTVIKGSRRSMRLAKAARSSGRGGGRKRILAAARELFAGRSYTDVSMQDVASAAGVTKAALYYHFADKGELYLRMLEDLVEDILVEERKVAAGPGSFEQRLTALAKQASDMWETDLFRVMQDAHQHLGEARHSEVHAAMDRLSEPVQVLFDAEYGSTGIDPRLAAALFQTTIAALIMSTRAGHEGPVDPRVTDSDARARMAVGLFLHGIEGAAAAVEG